MVTHTGRETQRQRGSKQQPEITGAKEWWAMKKEGLRMYRLEEATSLQDL